MIIVLREVFDGRRTDRYFLSWNNAKDAMLKDIKECCNNLHGKITKELDYFNSSKGFYVFEQEALFEDGKICHWSLLTEYYEDE